mgnify:FL=1
MFCKALLSLLVVCSSHVLAAETADGIKVEAAAIEKASDICMAEIVSNYDMGECSYQKLQAADSLLNRVYKAQVAELKKQIQEEKGQGPLGQFGEETLKRLVKAQKAWIAFRDAECDLAGTDMLFGSGERLLVSSCLAETTLARATKLGEFFGSSDPK